ncbi:MAG: TetR/AcrR family transcriptional regulator [Patescibacteria group bacterium]
MPQHERLHGKLTSKGLATRERILQAAADIFFSQRYEDSKRDDILSMSKVQTGNFYYYFDSMPHLFLATVKEVGIPQVQDWLDFILPADDPNALQQLPDRLVQATSNVYLIIVAHFESPSRTTPEYVVKIKNMVHDRLRSLTGSDRGPVTC